MFIATTTVSVLRTPPGTIDEFGDPADTDTVAVSGLPAHISTTRRTHLEPATGRLSTVEVTTIRLSWPGGTIDPENDRIRDDRLGQVLTIDTVNPDRYGGLGGDIELTSRRVY